MTTADQAGYLQSGEPIAVLSKTGHWRQAQEAARELVTVGLVSLPIRWETSAFLVTNHRAYRPQSERK